MRGWQGGLLAGLVLTGAAAAAGGAGYTWMMQPASEPGAPEVELEIPKGATGTDVARLLQSQGLLRHRRQWWLHVRLYGPEPSPKAGRHRVSASMNVAELRQALGGQPLPDDVRFTVVEGWRLVDTDQALAEAGHLPPGAYLRAAHTPDRFDTAFPVRGPTLEGYLFPETYRLPPDFEAEDLIRRQLEAFEARFFGPFSDEIAASSRDLSDLVIMASLLEREEPTPELRPKVGGVLFKRLDAGVALGVDATSRYRLDRWNDRRAFLQKLRDPKDPYNTRLKTGLPPTAIGAPGLPSLIAALRPVDSPYWYYLHDDEKRIHFAKSAKEHEANRRRYDVY